MLKKYSIVNCVIFFLFIQIVIDIGHDKRMRKYEKKYNIIDNSLFAMFANVGYRKEIEKFEKLYFKALKRYLELSNGVPS